MTGRATTRSTVPPRSAAETTLAAIGSAPHARFDIAEAALLLASLERPQVSLDRYRAHLADLDTAVAARGRGTRSAAGQAAALVAVIRDAEGYCGDDLTYDDLQNANLMRVIDRRKGLPVARIASTTRRALRRDRSLSSPAVSNRYTRRQNSRAS